MVNKKTYRNIWNIKKNTTRTGILKIINQKINIIYSKVNLNSKNSKKTK